MATGVPSLKTIRVGNFFSSKCSKTNFFSSTVFSLSVTSHRRKSTLSKYFGCALRSTLSRSLQGPQHGAKASTRTGRSGEVSGLRRSWLFPSVMVSILSLVSSAVPSAANSPVEILTLVDEKGAMNAEAAGIRVATAAANRAAPTALLEKVLVLLRAEFMLQISSFVGEADNDEQRRQDIVYCSINCNYEAMYVLAIDVIVLVILPGRCQSVKDPHDVFIFDGNYLL